jgi:hypothetical protein
LKPLSLIPLSGTHCITSISIKNFVRAKKSATEKKKAQQKLWTWNWKPNLLNLNVGWLTGEGGRLVDPCMGTPTQLTIITISRFHFDEIACFFFLLWNRQVRQILFLLRPTLREKSLNILEKSSITILLSLSFALANKICRSYKLSCNFQVSNFQTYFEKKPFKKIK